MFSATIEVTTILIYECVKCICDRGELNFLAPYAVWNQAMAPPVVDQPPADAPHILND